jgi:hypothetical protein
MALFSKSTDPDAKLRRELQAKLDARGDNVLRQEAAGVKLAEARSAVELAALGADESKLDAALSAKRAAEDKVAALSAASAGIGQEIAAIEQQLAEAADKRTRAATARELEGLIAKWQEAETAFVEAARAVQAVSDRAAMVCPEALGTSQFAQSAAQELPAAGAVIVSVLESHRRGVLAGGCRATLPKAAAPAPALAIVPPAPMMTLFAMKKLKYVDAAGSVVTVGAYCKHTFPKALGELAIRTKVAAALDDKGARELSATSLASVGVPDESSCQWLGEPGREAPDRYLRPGGEPVYRSTSPSPFTPVDRGAPYTVPIPRGPEPIAAGASRSQLPEEE